MHKSKLWRKERSNVLGDCKIKRKKEEKPIKESHKIPQIVNLIKHDILPHKKSFCFFVFQTEISHCTYEDSLRTNSYNFTGIWLRER